LAVKALPHQACLEERMAFGLTARASWTAGTPPRPGDNLQTYLGVRKGLDRLHQTTGISELNGFHELIISGGSR
jgi:hypothetical protein